MILYNNDSYLNNGILIKFLVISLLIFSSFFCNCMDQQQEIERMMQTIITQQKQLELRSVELALANEKINELETKLTLNEEKEANKRKAEDLIFLIKQQNYELATLEHKDQRWSHNGKIFPHNQVLYMSGDGWSFIDNTKKIKNKKTEIASNEAKLRLLIK